MAMFKNDLMEALSYDIENDFELEAMESAADEAFFRAQALHDRIYGTGSAMENILELFGESAEESLSIDDTEGLQDEYAAACEEWAKYAKEDMKAFIGKAKAFFVKMTQALKQLVNRFNIWVAEQRANKTKGINITDAQYEIFQDLGKGAYKKDIEALASKAAVSLSAIKDVNDNESYEDRTKKLQEQKRKTMKTLRRASAEDSSASNHYLKPAEIKAALKQAKEVLDAGSKALQDLARLPWDEAKPTDAERKNIRFHKKAVSYAMSVSSRCVKLLSSVMAKAHKSDKMDEKKNKNAGYSAASQQKEEEDLFA